MITEKHFEGGIACEAAPRQNDSTLVAAARGGDEGAFVELLRRHSAKVLRMTYRITKHKQDAEDAMQDAFLSAYLHLNTFDGRAQFSSWLTRIAINCALMILRRNRGRPEVSIHFDGEGDVPHTLDVPDTSVNPELHLLGRESIVRLRSAIRRLRPSLRKVVEIQQELGVTLKETAKFAALSVPATKSRMLRARSTLKRMLC